MEALQFDRENLIVWILKSAILLQCIGIFFILLSGSSVESLFFLEFDLDQSYSKFVENSIAFVVLFLGFTIFIQPKTLTLILLFLLIFIISWITQKQGGIPFANWSIPAHALRIVTPIGLLLLIKNSHDFSKAYTILILGLAVTFFTHGIEALSLHPRFIDYLLVFSNKFLSYNLQQSMAELILKIIGCLDIIMAILVIVQPKPGIFIWMAYWGLVTASVRMVELGWNMYPELLVRASHFLIPVSLLIIRNLTVYSKHPLLIK
jgi:hypothetical protein